MTTHRNHVLTLILTALTVIIIVFSNVHLTISTALPRAQAAEAVDVWWPTNGAHMQGTQPFKAMVSGLDVSQYQMFWQVDGGQWNSMDNNYTDYQHKEASVDLSGWRWHGSGPYVINFIVQKDGSVIGEQQETIYIDNGLPTMTSQPAQPTQPAPTPTSTPSTQTTTAPVTLSAPVVSVSGSKLYVDPNSGAANQANAWRQSRPQDAQAMDLLAAQSTAVWFGDWNGDVQSAVHNLVSAASAQGATPMMVAYNIPGRDCGSYSAGGSSDYQSWINSFAQGLGQSSAIVVLEPDALAQLSCLSQSDQQTRLSLLSQAVSVLKHDANARVYIDAGHPGWVDPGTMANDLRAANVAQADGFALNTSNFDTTTDNMAYGQQISGMLGGKHFVIDTARNGNGSDGQWCNPPGRAIGQRPTTATGNSLIDAYLWLKVPGESDGSCNGGPSAGTWWPDYALQLVHNAGL